MMLGVAPTTLLSEIREWHEVTREVFDQEIQPRHEPAILRGAVADWPVVQPQGDRPDALKAYLAPFGSGARSERSSAHPVEMRGRFFYSPSFDGFNFGQIEGELEQLLTAIVESRRSRYIYMGSTPAALLLPDFASENPFGLVDGRPTEPRLWIGSDSIVAPHFDELDNIACVVSGERHFTLFPPDQVSNLYIGPIDNTMAGQPASLVEIDNPDFDRFPRFHDALSHARVGELGPGDAIYIPRALVAWG